MYIAITLVGLFKLKSADAGLNSDYIVGLVFYVSGFFLWLVVLRWFPLSLAFPLAAGTIIVGTQFVGVYLLDENFNIISLLGVSLIIGGIITLGFLDYVKD